MKKIIIIIGAVGILAVLGWWYMGYASSSDNEFLFDDTDDNLAVTARVDIILGLADGNTKTITGYDGSPLSVEYDGDPITQVEWRLMMKATTPQGDEPYDSVQVTIAPTYEDDYTGSATNNFKLDASCYRINNIWSDSYSPGLMGDVYTASLTPNGEWSMIWSETIPMSTVFTGDLDTGGYSFKFEVSGQGAYRGYSQLKGGYGDWQTVSFTDYDMDATYSLQYTSQGATVDFDSTVNWS